MSKLKLIHENNSVALKRNYKYSTTYIIRYNNGNIERFFYYARVYAVDGLTQTEPKEDTISRSFNTPVLIITRYSRSSLLLPF